MTATADDGAIVRQASLETAGRWTRREILKRAALLGIGTIAFRRALAAAAEGAAHVTPGMIREAEWIAGLEFTKDERRLMAEDLDDTLTQYARLREIDIDNSVNPALAFHPAPFKACSSEAPARNRRIVTDLAGGNRPETEDDLAFAPLSVLASMIRAREISSVELTRSYLERMKRFDPVLHCVITLTEDLALRQAKAADREISSGGYRGPLHGIPWGAKDLLAVPGYRTTWGATTHRDQVRPEKATVVTRLEEAGAVLLAKLSLGALAWGDVWFDATTRNPWNVEQGSSGSSAGSASATAAGLVGFAIGSETWGSIVSPSTRCGVTGLRPTFGRVSRYGSMALSWSMDKLGAIARTAEDCALVFDAIHGADKLDPTAVDRPFEWPPGRGVLSLRVGYVKSLFEEDRASEIEDEEARAQVREWQEFDRRTLETLETMGFNLVPMELPDTYPVEPLATILTAEAATAFDALTRSGRDDLLVRQVRNAWPNVLRQGQVIPAVEYLRANRVRTLIMQELEKRLQHVDVYVAPSFGGSNLLMTNLTGHPAVVLPNGFRSADGTPTSITFTGKLYGETDVLALARAYQATTDFHRKRPPMADLPPETPPRIPSED